MDDRYLWDRSGDPDPFVARLERSLAAKREHVLRTGTSRGPRRLRSLALAAMTAAAAAVTLWAAFGRTWFPDQETSAQPPTQPAVVESDSPEVRSQPVSDKPAMALQNKVAEPELEPAGTATPSLPSADTSLNLPATSR